MGATALSSFSDALRDFPDRYKVFIAEYTQDFNGKRAAIAAGYKNPVRAAWQLLNNPKIARVIGMVLNKRQSDSEHNAERIMAELAFIAYRDPIDLVDPETGAIITNIAQLPERARRSIDTIKQRVHLDKDGDVSHIDIELKPIPKIAALELVMKHRQMLDGSQAKGDGGPSIDWKQLSGAQRAITEDPLENRILEVAKADTKSLNAAAEERSQEKPTS